MFFGPLIWILFIAIAVVLVIVLMRWLGGTGVGASLLPPPSGKTPSSGKTPLDILKERFARGEIDKEEFEERRRVLGE